MKVKIKSKTVKGNKDCIDILQNRKENAFIHSIKGLSLDKKTPVEILDVRFYGNGTRKYCCVWLKEKKKNPLLTINPNSNKLAVLIKNTAIEN